MCPRLISDQETGVLFTNYQPRSHGLSSSHPLERERGGGRKRDPGNEVDQLLQEPELDIQQGEQNNRFIKNAPPPPPPNN